MLLLARAFFHCFMWIPILTGIVVTLIVFVLLVILIGTSLSTAPFKGPESDHFNGRHFINPSRIPAKGFKDVAGYAQKRKPDKWPRDLDQSVRSQPIPIPDGTQIQYTFVNHSTFLIQHDGISILTDPIWSQRCSPFQFMGPKRQRPPGVPFSLLPKIDLVLISHNHYDHLDRLTVKKLMREHDPEFVVPLGVASLLRKWGCQRVTELDWHGSSTHAALSITALPANHFSSRGTRDRNTSLWCGYLISSAQKKIYYVGDTGYSPCLLYTSPSPRDRQKSRMPSSA